MMKITSRTNIILMIALYILVMVCIILNNHYYIDSFLINRLSEINSIDSEMTTISPSFVDMPYAYILFWICNSVLRIDYIDMPYLPIVLLIATLSLLALGNEITKFSTEKNVAFPLIVPTVLLSTSVSIRYFLPSIPLTEYYFGCALIPLFVCMYLKYNNNAYPKNRFSLSVGLIIVFCAIHFFSVPMSAWIIIILASVSLFQRIIPRLKRGDPPYKNAQLLMLFMVIWLITNAKFIHALQTWSLDPGALLDVFTDTFYAQSHEGSIGQQYQYREISGNLIQKTSGMLYLILIITPFLLKCGYEIIRKEKFSWLNTHQAIVIISLSMPLFFELIVYGSKGYLTTRYLMIIYPFVSYVMLLILVFDDRILENIKDARQISKIRHYANYFAFNKNRLISIFTIMMLITSSTFTTIYFIGDTKHEQPPNVAGIKVAHFIWDKIPQQAKITTGYNTQGYLCYFSNSKSGTNGNRYISFTDIPYKNIICSEASNVTPFDIFIMDYMNVNRPIIQGPPEWIRYSPLSVYQDKIESNTQLNRIFASEYFIIFQTG